MDSEMAAPIRRLQERRARRLALRATRDDAALTRPGGHRAALGGMVRVGWPPLLAGPGSAAAE